MKPAVEIEQELAKFAEGPRARDRLEAVRALFTANVPQKEPQHPQLQYGLTRLLEAAEAGEERLEAVAALGRVLRGVKVLAPVLAPGLDRAFAEPLPPLAAWADAEDRRFVALAVSEVRPAWSAVYAAEFMLTDDSSPRAREAFAPLLIEATGSVEATLAALAREACLMEREPFERSARALRLTLGALTSAMPLGVTVGAAAPSQLTELVSALLPQVAAGQDRQVRIETAAELLRFLLLLLNGSVSASLQPESYGLLRTLHGWFAPAQWPDELKPPVKTIVARLAEAIETLAARGTPDDQLFRALEQVVGREEALEQTRGILQRRPGLPASVHAWLRLGPGARAAQHSADAEEASLRQTDPALARALMLVRSLQGEAVETSDQGGAAGRVRMMRLVNEAVQAIRMVAATRGLRMLGQVGEVAEFDPAVHRMARPNERALRVKILQPAVIRQLGNSPVSVVQFALVEAVEGQERGSHKGGAVS